MQPCRIKDIVYWYYQASFVFYPLSFITGRTRPLSNSLGSHRVTQMLALSPPWILPTDTWIRIVICLFAFFFVKYVSHPKHLSSLYSSLGEQGFPGCHPPKLTLGSIWYQVRIRIRIRIRITITITIIFISGLGSVWYEANSLQKIHLTTSLKMHFFDIRLLKIHFLKTTQCEILKVWLSLLGKFH